MGHHLSFVVDDSGKKGTLFTPMSRLAAYYKNMGIQNLSLYTVCVPSISKSLLKKRVSFFPICINMTNACHFPKWFRKSRCKAPWRALHGNVEAQSSHWRRVSPPSGAAQTMRFPRKSRHWSRMVSALPDSPCCLVTGDVPAWVKHLRGKWQQRPDTCCAQASVLKREKK